MKSKIKILMLFLLMLFNSGCNKNIETNINVIAPNELGIKEGIKNEELEKIIPTKFVTFSYSETNDRYLTLYFFTYKNLDYMVTYVEYYQDGIYVYEGVIKLDIYENRIPNDNDFLKIKCHMPFNNTISRIGIPIDKTGSGAEIMIYMSTSGQKYETGLRFYLGQLRIPSIAIFKVGVNNLDEANN